MQFSRPNSDLGNNGWSSTGAAYYTEIDESSASDSDINQSTDTAIFEYDILYGLQDVAYPNYSLLHSLRVRMMKANPVAQGMNVILYQSAFPIATFNQSTLTTGFVDYDFAITESDALNLIITGGLYQNLRLYLQTTGVILGSPNRVLVSQAYFTVPNIAFFHADIPTAGTGIHMVGPNSGNYLTIAASGSGFHRQTGTETSGALIDGGGGSTPWMKASV